MKLTTVALGLGLAACWAAAGPAYAATEGECATKLTETLALEKNLRSSGARKKFAVYVDKAKKAQADRNWDACVQALAVAIEKGPPPKQ